MTIQDGNVRSKVRCNNPAKCGVKWHWADTSPACGATSSQKIRAVDGLVSAPRAKTRGNFTRDGHGISLHFSDEEWEAFSQSADAVHGLHVNRHALESVVEKVTSGGDVLDEVMSDPEQALAYEVLCIDPDSRAAVARAYLGAEASSDDAMVEESAGDLEALLANSHYTNESNDGGLSLDAFPHTKQRIAGVLDAAFEAQRKKHAFDAMKKDVTQEMYADHPDRVGQKWTVRGHSVLPYDAKSERVGDIIVNMSERIGAYDAKLAKDELTDEEWESAKGSMSASDIPVSVTDIKKAAATAGISLDPFKDVDTTKVRVMVSHGAGTDKEMDSTTKAEGIKEWKAGRSTFGSRFYVPDVSEMDEERAFATLSRARARADRNHAEAHEVAQTIHAGIRGIESVALNQTLRYGDTDREYTFQVNKTERFNTEAFDDVHPEIRRGIQASRHASGDYQPTQAAAKSALESSRPEGAESAFARARKDSAPSPRISDVVSGDDGTRKKEAPSATGKSRAESRISRGEALNGRILTESSFCPSED